MSAAETLKKLPTIGRDMLNLILHPGSFVRSWAARPDRPTNKEVLGWALALSALLFALYDASTGTSPFESIATAYMNVRSTEPTSTGPAPRPSWGGLRWMPGVGVGVSYPQLFAKGLKEPQIVAFNMGPGVVIVKDVIPSKAGSKVAELLILNLYLYSIALCLYPAVWLFHRDLDFRQFVSVANLLAATTWAAGSLIIVAAVLILVHLLRLHGIPLVVTWEAVVVLPLFTLLIRAFWVGLRTISGLKTGRFLCSLLISYAISWIVFPVFAPLLYGILRFQALLDAVL